MTEDFKRVYYLGRTKDGRTMHVTVRYEKGNLSITGVEGARANGNCAGSCGQTGVPPMRELATGWTAAKVKKLRSIWDKWHLNGMQAGSPAQTAWLRKNGYQGYDQDKARLEAVGLSPDERLQFDGTPYVYGSKWLHVHVPLDVLEWLQQQPQADNLPASWY